MKDDDMTMAMTTALTMKFHEVQQKATQLFLIVGIQRVG